MESLSPSQWQFLANLAACESPLSVNTLADLCPLTPGDLLQLISRGTGQGWLVLEDDRLHLATATPAGFSRRVAALQTPELMAALLDGLAARGEDDLLPSPARARLLAAAGRTAEAARLHHDLAQAAVRDRDPETALRHLEAVTTLLSPADDPALFLSAALTRVRLSLYTGHELETLPGLLETARNLAEKLGDRRSGARVKLLGGRLAALHNRPDEALELLDAGIVAAEELGDDDITQLSSEYQGLAAYIRGHYREAVPHFERALQLAAVRGDLHGALTPLYLGYAAAIIGQFNRALGVLDCNWRRCRQEGRAEMALVYRAALGMVLVMMDRHRAGMAHLMAVDREAHDPDHNRARYFALMGISYCHFVEGRISEAHRVAHEAAVTVARQSTLTWPVGPQWTWPVALEILAAFARLGLEPIPGYDVDEQIRRLEAGPNVCLRGTVRRIRARELDDPAAARALLLTSAADLELAGDALGLARTRAELAVSSLRAGREEAARDLALRAWEGLSGYGLEFFPAELQPLVCTDEPAGDHHDLLRRYLDMMEDFVPGTDLDERLSLMLASSARFFAAERSGLFWCETDGRPPRLKAGHNLSAREILHEDFRPRLELVLKTLRGGQPLVSRPAATPGARQAPAVLCLPLESKGRLRGVLYHENRYLEHAFEGLDRALLRRIARQFGAYIERVGEYCRLAEARTRQETIPGPAEAGLVRGASPVMDRILERAHQVAATDAAVLVLGETGVGKELLARSLHEQSPRQAGPFVAVDLTSTPETLVESELFGHERGAFTGADRRRAGRLEQAHQGTLFIDEVGDIPAAIQVKLLRALQEKTFTRIGGAREIHADFRLVAATNRDLEEEVARGRFREDLFYRLNVVPLEIPPLRERDEDIIVLAEHFLARYARKYARSGLELSSAHRRTLSTYPWPGNVRELQNIMERSVILSAEGRFELALPGPTRRVLPPGGTRPTLDEVQRAYILEVLEETGGRIGGLRGAAEILGLKRTTLYTRMKKLGIEG